MYKTIHLDAPNVGSLEKRYLENAIDTGYVSTVGPFIPKFEARFAKFLSVKMAVSTQSGTEALHMALYQLGIGKQDEVIVPALTFVGTVSPVMYMGATPVFVDVDRKTWNIDPGEIEKNITKRTKAIIAVHLYGNPCDMAGITKIAKRHDLSVIEDATESLGARSMKKYTGTFGDFGCFSFNGNKIITTGGGGMIVGADITRLEHIKFLVNQARDGAKGYYHPEVGFNYRMTNIEAALGLAQMDRLKEFLRKKQAFSQIYRKELKRIDFIRFQESYDGTESSYWLNCITFEKDVDIESLQARLIEKGFVTRKVFTPIIDFPPYKMFKKCEFENSYGIYKNGLCLPSSTLNSEEDIYDGCRIFKKFIEDV